MVYDDNHEAQVDVKYGSIEILPLANGQSAKLTLHPCLFFVGFGSGHGGVVRVRGGAHGCCD